MGDMPIGAAYEGGRSIFDLELFFQGNHQVRALDGSHVLVSPDMEIIRRSKIKTT